MMWLTDFNIVTVEADVITSAVAYMPEEPAPSSSSTASTAIQFCDNEPSAISSADIGAATEMKCQRKIKRKANKVGDDELFNKWLSSEIEKNKVKTELMKCKMAKLSAQKEFIELQKIKTTFEIQNLQAETQPTLFGTEF